jgi:hypothetical protein
MLDIYRKRSFSSHGIEEKDLLKSSMKRAECYNLGLDITYAAREAPITLELSIGGWVDLKVRHGR